MGAVQWTSVDIRTGCVGEVVGSYGPYLRLRPPAGGREWGCPPALTRTATAEERLRAKPAEVNHHSRRPEW